MTLFYIGPLRDRICEGESFGRAFDQYKIGDFIVPAVDVFKTHAAAEKALMRDIRKALEHHQAEVSRLSHLLRGGKL